MPKAADPSEPGRDWPDDAVFLRLLQAANDLRYFTLRDIAAHADLPEAAVSAFARDHPELIETLDDAGGEAGGSRPCTHRLRPARCLSVAERLSQAPGREQKAAYLPEGHPMRKAPTLLQLLEDTVRGLQGGDLASGSLDEELACARLQLLGAQASLSDRRELGDPVGADEAFRLAAAEAALAALRPGGRHAAPLPAEGWARLLQHVADAVFDWTETPPDWDAMAATGLQATADREPERLIERLLASPPWVEAALWPAANLLLAGRGAGKDWHGALARALARRIEAIEARSAADLAGLAVAAGMLDAEPAAQPLFVALLRARHETPLADAALSLCHGALARLARPWGATSQARAAAAAACAYLALHTKPLAASERLALAPAALGAEHAASGALLDDMAAALAEAGRHGSARMSASMRNLAVTLHRQHFEPLDRHLAALLATGPGRALVGALGDPSTNALVFVDTDGGKTPYEVRLRPLVLASLGVRGTAAAHGARLALAPGSADSDVLEDLVTEEARRIRSEGFVASRLRARRPAPSPAFA